MREIRDPELSLHVTVWETIQRLKPTNAIPFHPANGLLRHKRVAEMLQLMGVVPGVSDFIILLRGGRVACLELKTTSGRLSAGQIEFRATCLLLGIPYEIARTLEEALDCLKLFGVEFENSIDLELGEMRLGQN